MPLTVTHGTKADKTTPAAPPSNKSRAIGFTDDPPFASLHATVLGSIRRTRGKQATFAEDNCYFIATSETP
jgi:hypothetical protein